MPAAASRPAAVAFGKPKNAVYVKENVAPVGGSDLKAFFGSQRAAHRRKGAGLSSLPPKRAAVPQQEDGESSAGHEPPDLVLPGPAVTSAQWPRFYADKAGSHASQT